MHMTLKRLMIFVAILVFLATVGSMWLWQYAYSPEGRARVIIAQLKGDDTTLRGWMLKHHLVRPGYTEPPHRGEGTYTYDQGIIDDREDIARGELVKLGPEVLPVVIEALRDRNRDVRRAAIRVCGKFPDPAAIEPLVQCMREANQDWPQEGIVYRNGLRLVGSPDIQKLCVNSLIEIGPEASGSLMNANEWDRPRLPALLAEKWGAAAIPCLRQLLTDSDSDVRRSATKALEKLGVKPTPSTYPEDYPLLIPRRISRNLCSPERLRDLPGISRTALRRHYQPTGGFPCLRLELW
jgi:hypothetical protein